MSSTAFSLHWWITSHVFIQKMYYSLTSCQLYFLVPLSSFLAHLLALSHKWKRFQHRNTLTSSWTQHLSQLKSLTIKYYNALNESKFYMSRHAIHLMVVIILNYLEYDTLCTCSTCIHMCQCKCACMHWCRYVCMHTCACRSVCVCVCVCVCLLPVTESVLFFY